MHRTNSSEMLPEPTVGVLPYNGPSCYDRRTVVIFEGLTQSKAEEYLITNYAKFNDFHSMYIPNIVHTIESHCFCQDKLIAND